MEEMYYNDELQGQDLPTNKRYKGLIIFICLIYLAGFLTSAFAYVYMYYLFSSDLGSFFPIKLMPIFSSLGPLYLILSIYMIYLFIISKTMSKKGWIFSLTLIIPTIASYIIWKFGISEFHNFLVDEKPPFISKLLTAEILSLIFFVIIPIFIFILLIFLKNKFINSQSKISKKSTIFITSYSLIVIVLISLFYISSILSISEKPYIGYKDAEEVLGVEPLTFGYIPEGYIQNAALITNDNRGFSIAYTRDGIIGDIDSFTVITQTTNDNQIENNTDDLKEDILMINGNEFTYGSSGQNSRHYIEGKKRGINLTIVSANKEVVTKEMLINIAKSSQ